MTPVTNEPMLDNAEASFVYEKPEARVRNEFTAVIERDEDWFVAHCLEIPGPTVRAGQERMGWKTWRRRYCCTWKCAGRMAYGEFRLKQFAK